MWNIRHVILLITSIWMVSISVVPAASTVASTATTTSPRPFFESASSKKRKRNRSKKNDAASPLLETPTNTKPDTTIQQDNHNSKQQQLHSPLERRIRALQQAPPLLQIRPLLLQLPHLQPTTISQRRIGDGVPTKTRVGRIVQLFTGILDPHTGEIYMAPLLNACQHFVQEMKDVGQHQSARDMQQNLVKTKEVYQACPFPQIRQSMQSLLEYEKTHHPQRHDYEGVSSSSFVPGNKKKQPIPKLLRLNERSAAIGLLWIRRSISFQNRMFRHLLEDIDDEQENDHDHHSNHQNNVQQKGRHPSKHHHHHHHHHASASLRASFQAYDEELRHFHGVFLQKIYVLALKATSTHSKHDTFARLGGFRLEEFGPEQEMATKRDLRQLVDLWTPLIQRWEQIYEELNLEDRRKV